MIPEMFLGFVMLGRATFVTCTGGPWWHAEMEVTTEYEKAVEQVCQNDLRGAIKSLTAILQSHPDFFRASNLMGICYERLGDHERANRAFLQALRVNPRFDEAHTNLGANYVAQGRISEGIAEFRKAIELNPKSISAFFDLGATELEQGRPSEAANWLRKAYVLSHHDSLILVTLIGALIESGRIGEALRYDEEDSPLSGLGPQLHWKLGLLFLKVRQWDAATRNLKAATQADSVLRTQLKELGEEAFSQGKYSSALCLADVALEFEPDSASLHSLAGACYYHLKNPAKAVAEAQEAIHLEPRNEAYYIQLAQVFIDYNTPEPAVLLLEPAVSMFPSSGKLLLVLGVACLKSSQLKKAELYLKQSLRLQPQDPLVLRALANLYEGLREWQSLEEIGRSLANIPSQAYMGFYFQAEAYHNLLRNQPDGFPLVVQVLRKSLALEPNFPSSHYLMGKCLLDNGSYQKAVESFNRAIALDPTLASAYYNLAMAYNKLGAHRKSQEALKRFHAASSQEKITRRSLDYQVLQGQPASGHQ